MIQAISKICRYIFLLRALLSIHRFLFAADDMDGLRLEKGCLQNIIHNERKGGLHIVQKKEAPPSSRIP